MRSIRYGTPAAPAASLNDEFDGVRCAFYSRLQRDRLNLAYLSAQLACAAEQSTCVFDEIRSFAHRLRGAAVIFEAFELGGAAHTLEQAANAAFAAHADNDDAGVWAAIECLAERLTGTNGARARGGSTRKGRPRGDTHALQNGGVRATRGPPSICPDQDARPAK